MNNESKQALLHAAELLTKAASCLEYNVNLSKEAAATADAMISQGMLGSDQRTQYTDFLKHNPEKIASMNNALKDLKASGVSALGEVSGSNSSAYTDDAFDRAILGL